MTAQRGILLRLSREGLCPLERPIQVSKYQKRVGISQVQHVERRSTSWRSRRARKGTSSQSAIRLSSMHSTFVLFDGQNRCFSPCFLGDPWKRDAGWLNWRLAVQADYGRRGLELDSLSASAIRSLVCDALTPPRPFQPADRVVAPNGEHVCHKQVPSISSQMRLRTRTNQYIGWRKGFGSFLSLVQRDLGGSFGVECSVFWTHFLSRFSRSPISQVLSFRRVRSSARWTWRHSAVEILVAAAVAADRTLQVQPRALDWNGSLPTRRLFFFFDPSPNPTRHPRPPHGALHARPNLNRARNRQPGLRDSTVGPELRRPRPSAAGASTPRAWAARR